MQLQQDVLTLTEEESPPLMFLESFFQLECIPLPKAPSNGNNNLQCFGRRNILRWTLPKHISAWMFYRHRKEARISKLSALHIAALHKMWLERCATCHKNTSNRIEYHERLMNNAERMFDARETLPQELETHRGKVDSIPSELLRAFLCEFCAHSQDHSSSIHLISHTLNAAVRFCPDISEEAVSLHCVTNAHSIV